MFGRGVLENHSPCGCITWHAAYGNALRALDLGIGNITTALKAHNMWENTLLFVIADNGGDNPGGSASNYPLMGRKCLSWEGGTRVYALANGGLIPTGQCTAQIIHVWCHCTNHNISAV